MGVVLLGPETPDPSALAEAVALLRAGQIVAFPTETVYGLGANALDPAAVARIYEAKGRPAINPLIVHVPDQAHARELVTRWPDSAERLAARYWPGPLTLVLPRTAAIPDIVTAGLPSVALRAPAHPVALALLRAAGLPLAAPSANRSGEVSPTTAGHVLRSLGNRVPLVLDAGPTSVGIESTVVDLTRGIPVLLRPGMISRAELESVVGPVALPDAAGSDAAPRAAPGMLRHHYAPRGRVLLFDDAGAGAVEAAVIATREAGGRSAALVLGARPAGVDEVIPLPDTAAEYARQLYAALHRLDDAGTDLILIERPPAGSAWEGVRDRLQRAAAPRPGVP